MTDHEDAIDRKRRSERKLEAQGIRVLDSLPCLVPRSSVRVRSQEETLIRGACAAVIYYRTGLDFLADLDDYLREENLYPYLTEAEKQFYFTPDVREHKDYAAFTWKIEAFHVILWALGSFDRIEAPDVPVDDATLYHHFFSTDLAGVRGRVRLRSLGEMLDAADYYFRFYETMRYRNERGLQIPCGLSFEIIRERYVTLLWLLGKAEWDELHKST